MIPAPPPFERLPCRYCEDGYIEDPDDASAPWIECEFCKGTGDRFGRGPTLPHPTEWQPPFTYVPSGGGS